MFNEYVSAHKETFLIFRCTIRYTNRSSPSVSREFKFSSIIWIGMNVIYDAVYSESICVAIEHLALVTIFRMMGSIGRLA